MRKMLRRPTPPGEILREEFLRPLKLTQTEFAARLGCTRSLISRIVIGRSEVTAEMATRLAAVLGTTPEFWLNAEQASAV